MSKNTPFADNCVVVVPWHREEELSEFLCHWGIPSYSALSDWLVLQYDKAGEGCGATKNKGIAVAMEMGAETVVVIDGDCYPERPGDTLLDLAQRHREALKPQPVRMFEPVTEPPSRGTPYSTDTIEFPVAASMGFWTENGDHCAVRQLALNNASMRFKQKPIYGRYFALCGMNLAFNPREWLPWCQFIDVPRFDDIWMGWLWQREAYRRGYCFNLSGPMVRHSRQSNVWKNLRDESLHLEKSEALWSEIAQHPADDYDSLRQLLPV